jgi:hypothetical protein
MQRIAANHQDSAGVLIDWHAVHFRAEVQRVGHAWIRLTLDGPGSDPPPEDEELPGQVDAAQTRTVEVDERVA